MKTYISILIISVALVSQSCEQKTSYANLPQSVKTSFAEHVSNPKNVVWEENPDYYFAYFTDKGEKGIAIFYKADGSWVETEEALTKKDLIKDLTPDQLKTLSKYKNFKIKGLVEEKGDDETDKADVELVK